MAVLGALIALSVDDMSWVLMEDEEEEAMQAESEDRRESTRSEGAPLGGDGFIDGLMDGLREGQGDSQMNGVVNGGVMVDGVEDTRSPRAGAGTPVTDQRILSLLYLIAEDYARRSGYVHRGVTCNGCGASPIRGARYHCTECADVDLCQFCESARRHSRYHVLVKSKVPIPVTLGPRWVQQSWRPRAARNARVSPPDRLPDTVCESFAARFDMAPQEVAAAWQCFRPLVDVSLADLRSLAETTTTTTPDSRPPVSECDFAATRKTVCQTLVPRNPSGLMAERIAAVYDLDGDGLVLFDDVLRMRAAQTDLDLKLHYGFKALDISNRGRLSRQDAREVLSSVAETSKDEAIDISGGPLYQRSLAHFLPNDSRPLSTFFHAHITPGDSYPPKSAAMASASSPLAYLQREYGPTVAVSRHSRALGQLSDLQLTYGTRYAINEAAAVLVGAERYDLDFLRGLPVQEKLDRAGLCDWLFTTIV